MNQLHATNSLRTFHKTHFQEQQDAKNILPEVITSSINRMCDKDVVLVVKRQVKFNIPKMKKRRQERSINC